MKQLPDTAAHWDDGNEPVAHARPVAAPPTADPWTALRGHTPARIALGRAGTSLPTAEVLRFAAAHAQARDAVHLPLDVDALAAALGAGGHASVHVASRAATRAEYLARPDLGRRLSEDGRAALQRLAGDAAPRGRLRIVVGDGLSAVAAQSHAAALVAALEAALAAALPDEATIVCDEIVIATQARVALGDDIGALLDAPLLLMLVGERPGLSSPDSLGAYLTFGPCPGRADSERNCVSNIRPDGLAPVAAAGRIAWLVREALRRRVTGVALKDDSDMATLDRPADGTAGPPALPGAPRPDDAA